MNVRAALAASLMGICLLPGSALAHGKAVGPEMAGRTYASNYKDMALTVCVATAYKQDAGVDAGSSYAALRDFTYYDLEKAPEAMTALVEKYLQRDYRNPVADAEAKQEIKFNMLKCLDLYHSKELSDQVKRFVDKPNRTDRQDNPKK